MLNERVKFKIVSGSGCQPEPLTGTILDKVRVENCCEGKTNIDAYVLLENDSNKIHIVKPIDILEVI